MANGNKSGSGISRRIIAQGGRMPIANPNQRVLGPTWFTLTSTYTDNTVTSSDLTSNTAWNGSLTARGTYSNTSQTPDAICHIEAFQVVMNSSVYHGSTAALKASFGAATYLKAQIGGSTFQFDAIRGIFEPFGANAKSTGTGTAGDLSVNRYMGHGPVILPAPIRVDLLDDQLTLETDTAVNFGSNVNLEVHVYGWLYPRTMADNLPQEGGCAPGTVTVERARVLNTSFQQQLLTSILS